jgi:hypothetical protein
MASGSWPGTSAPAHGASPAPAAHAVHGDALAALDVRDDVVGAVHEARAFRIIGRTAAHEILQSERRDAAGAGRRRGVVGQAHDVPSLVGGNDDQRPGSAMPAARQGSGSPVSRRVRTVVRKPVCADREQPQRHAADAAIVNHARKRSPGTTSGACRPARRSWRSSVRSRRSRGRARTADRTGASARSEARGGDRRPPTRRSAPDVVVERAAGERRARPATRRAGQDGVRRQHASAGQRS